MKSSNPFATGDRVICQVDLKGAVYIAPSYRTSGSVTKIPQRGDELIVSGVHRGLVRFDECDGGNDICWWQHNAFLSVDVMNSGLKSLI